MTILARFVPQHVIKLQKHQSQIVISPVLACGRLISHPRALKLAYAVDIFEKQTTFICSIS